MGLNLMNKATPKIGDNIMRNAEPLPKETTKQVESVEKALCLLECFSDRSPELSLKQLSEKTGLYKSRILRLCGTLIAHGFLIRMDGSAYRLGPALLMLGKVYERSNSLISLARPVLRELASLTGQSAKIFIVEGTRRMCLAREKGTYPLRYAVNEGETFALHAGASGKVLLAYSSPEFRKTIMNRTLQRITEATITARDRLEKEFDSICKRGYATSIGEVVPEVAGIAAPVFGHNNEIVAAIALSGLIQHFTKERSQEMCKHLLAASQKLSELLGCKDFPLKSVC